MKLPAGKLGLEVDVVVEVLEPDLLLLPLLAEVVEFSRDKRPLRLYAETGDSARPPPTAPRVEFESMVAAVEQLSSITLLPEP